jgi:hypothetical protein
MDVAAFLLRAQEKVAVAQELAAFHLDREKLKTEAAALIVAARSSLRG